LAGRLSGGEADFALSHGEASGGIHDEEHVVALVAEVLGNGKGDETGTDAKRRGAVGGSGDYD
jgi:hypothetical protein